MVTVDINLTPTATLFEIEASKSNLSNSSGKITGRTWGTPSECQAAVLLVHGLGAHSGWFEALARRLKVRKLFVLSCDLTGFGKRTKQKYVSVKQWFNDLTAAYAYLKSLTSDKPIYIVGNSMGALVALKSCSLITPAGLILLSPAFEGNGQTFPLTYRLKTLFKALLRPNEELELPYNPDFITSDQPAREWLARDPEGRFSVPGRMLLDLLGMTQKLYWQKIALNCPVLMLTAGQDRLVDNRVNHKLFQKLQCPHKELKSFTESFHDLTLEPVVDEVADEISSWVMSNAPDTIAAH